MRLEAELSSVRLLRDERLQLGSLEHGRPERILDAEALRVDEENAHAHFSVAMFANHKHADEPGEMVSTVSCQSGVIGTAQPLAPSGVHPAAAPRSEAGWRR